MGLIDLIRELLGNNKKNTRLITKDLTKTYGEKNQLEVGLYENANPIEGQMITININGVDYNRKTDNNGIARLNINLNVGEYRATIDYHGNDEYNHCNAYCNVVITEPTVNVTENDTHYGYWIFGRDMDIVDLNKLVGTGVTDIFLNYYAFSVHGESKVLSWIQNAKNKNINVHIWMQAFYNGEWINPATNDLSDKVNEAKYYAELNGVAGVHLDYLRYPGTAYKTNGGTDAITKFAKQVKEVIGNKFLSCAVMPEINSEHYYGQDITALGKIMDAIIPMQYKGNYNAGTNWLGSTTKSFAAKSKIWSGLQSYHSDDDPTLLSESELLNDAKTCIDNGAKGVILFRYGLSHDINFNSLTTTSHDGKKATFMEGTEINMTYKDGTQYQCAVYDDIGRVAGNVNITVNGRTYQRTPNLEGLYKLTINLEPGTYPIRAEYLGDDTHLPSNVNNTIVVNETHKPTELYPYITEKGSGRLGQVCGYSCGPHSLMQCIYRLTGIELSESTLMSVCGTTTSGTDHLGLETGLAWFNKEYDYNLKMAWKNFSEVGFDGLQQYYEQGAVFLHLCYRDMYGHYEVPLSSSSDPNKILNSLGDRDGNGYYGYIESRSKSTQKSYINGISQKSVCIIYK